jgi:hypothetical protein
MEIGADDGGSGDAVLLPLLWSLLHEDMEDLAEVLQERGAVS